MTDSPRIANNKQKSAKSPINRYVAIAFALAALGFGVYSISNRPVAEKVEVAKMTPTKTSLERLYREAREDMKNNRAKAALGKFRQIANIRPGFRDTEAQIQKIVSKLNDPSVAGGNGNVSSDPGTTGNAGNDGPGNAGNDGPGNAGNDGSDTSGSANDNDGTRTQNNTTGTGAPVNENNSGTLKPIPDGAAPIDLHVEEISGYVQTVKRWKAEPIESRSVYLPIAREVRTEIDRVIVTIAKYNSAALADEALQASKDNFTLEMENITLNGHDANASVDDTSDDELYRLKQIAAVSWTRKEWFFSVEVLPSFSGTPSNEFKKGIARYIAGAIGY